MSDIVIGYDGGPCAKAALDRAAELAKGLGDKIVIVFGYDPKGYGGGEVPSHRDAVHDWGEKITGEAAEQARALDVQAEIEILPLRGAQALLDVAEKRGARMIVVGSYGEGPLKGAILGSVPYKLVQLSKVPVLVVRES
jgi:nucleotide-binding universal stress UspA family protein